MTVEGSCSPRFARVREEFERNFAERGEVGATVCVILDGEPVVDLWGGAADPTTNRPWERDTIHVIMSCSKGVTALCGNMLVDRGQLDLDAPVARYWPEFAKNGKADIPVRMVFNHQSGVAHVSENISPRSFTDWDLIVGLIENTTPFWEPGTRCGYHGMTIGWLIGELVRRITGKSIGAFFREEVAEPLGIDCWLGLPEEPEPRVAHAIIPADADPDALPPRFVAALSDPSSLASHMFIDLGAWLSVCDTREAHAGEVPAGNAISNARGLAGMYAPLSLGGAIDGVRLVSQSAIHGMRYPQSMTAVDAVFGTRTNYTLGFSKSWPNRELPGHSVIIGEDAFGASGLGGQQGFADPSCRLAFAYTMTKHGAGTGLNARGQSLVDATYTSLGSPTCEPGFWVRPQ